jgi:hypothetical protein
VSRRPARHWRARPPAGRGRLLGRSLGGGFLFGARTGFGLGLGLGLPPPRLGLGRCGAFGFLPRPSFGSRALFRFALALSLLGQGFLLATQVLRLAVSLLLAPLERLGVGILASRRIATGQFVALHVGPLLAHLDLDGAGLAGGVRLLDLGGGLAHQRDLLAGGRRGAMRGAQVRQQLGLVALGDGVLRGRLAHASRLQLLQQRRCRAIQLGSQLGDGGHGHKSGPWMGSGAACAVGRFEGRGRAAAGVRR